MRIGLHTREEGGRLMGEKRELKVSEWAEGVVCEDYVYLNDVLFGDYRELRECEETFSYAIFDKNGILWVYTK